MCAPIAVLIVWDHDLASYSGSQALTVPKNPSTAHLRLWFQRLYLVLSLEPESLDRQ